jgi:hypothetical protein
MDSTLPDLSEGPQVCELAQINWRKKKKVLAIQVTLLLVPTLIIAWISRSMPSAMWKPMIALFGVMVAIVALLLIQFFRTKPLQSICGEIAHSVNGSVVFFIPLHSIRRIVVLSHGLIPFP